MWISQAVNPVSTCLSWIAEWFTTSYFIFIKAFIYVYICLVLDSGKGRKDSTFPSSLYCLGNKHVEREMKPWDICKHCVGVMRNLVSEGWYLALMSEMGVDK